NQEIDAYGDIYLAVYGTSMRSAIRVGLTHGAIRWVCDAEGRSTAVGTVLNKAVDLSEAERDGGDDDARRLLMHTSYRSHIEYRVAFTHPLHPCRCNVELKIGEITCFAVPE